MTPPDEFLITVELTDDGGYRFQLPDDAFKIDPNVFIGLGFWDESREGFSWEEDADDATELCLMALRRNGVNVLQPDHLKRCIRTLSIPGGPGPGAQMFWVRMNQE